MPSPMDVDRDRKSSSKPRKKAKVAAKTLSPMEWSKPKTKSKTKSVSMSKSKSKTKTKKEHSEPKSKPAAASAAPAAPEADVKASKAPSGKTVAIEVIGHYEKIMKDPKTEFDKKYILLHIHPDKVNGAFSGERADLIRKNAQLVTFINDVFKQVYEIVKDGKTTITKEKLYTIINKLMYPNGH